MEMAQGLKKAAAIFLAACLASLHNLAIATQMGPIRGLFSPHPGSANQGMAASAAPGILELWIPRINSVMTYLILNPNNEGRHLLPELRLLYMRDQTMSLQPGSEPKLLELAGQLHQRLDGDAQKLEANDTGVAELIMAWDRAVTDVREEAYRLIAQAQTGDIQALPALIDMQRRNLIYLDPNQDRFRLISRMRAVTLQLLKQFLESRHIQLRPDLLPEIIDRVMAHGPADPSLVRNLPMPVPALDDLAHRLNNSYRPTLLSSVAPLLPSRSDVLRQIGTTDLPIHSIGIGHPENMPTISIAAPLQRSPLIAPNPDREKKQLTKRFMAHAFLAINLLAPIAASFAALAWPIPWQIPVLVTSLLGIPAAIFVASAFKSYQKLRPVRERASWMANMRTSLGIQPASLPELVEYEAPMGDPNPNAIDAYIAGLENAFPGYHTIHLEQRLWEKNGFDDHIHIIHRHANTILRQALNSWKMHRLGIFSGKHGMQVASIEGLPPEGELALKYLRHLAEGLVLKSAERGLRVKHSLRTKRGLRAKRSLRVEVDLQGEKIGSSPATDTPEDQGNFDPRTYEFRIVRDQQGTVAKIYMNVHWPLNLLPKETPKGP